ncbi:PREDICTED: S-locus-specific glycoprotein S6-like [Populus euphratica]|uniref:S-locus-specific glycoprotein S6-like n=1 Tax=Populus euphratica TaxID=75702 RepID=A0AAJ6T373_POPEU|nr:PREDICTED: S-locus-specific glycoprotein S6-like [Populus euphratica]
MTSWKSLQDPSSRDFTYSVDVHGLSQLVLCKGSEIIYRSAPWDGVRFGGWPPLQENPVFNPIFVQNSGFVYYAFEHNENTTISRFVLNQSSLIRHLTWNPRRGEWVVIFTLPTDQCDIYAPRGPNGVCNINNSLHCKCKEGFTPEVPQDWDNLDWSSGCVRKTPLNCTSDEGFKKFPG